MYFKDIRREFMKAVSVLIQEHNIIKKMIELLKMLSQNPDKLKKVSVSFYDSVIDFFHVYADLCHHGKEEKGLFERLKEKGILKEINDLMCQLIEEHKIARQLMHELDNMKNTKDYKKISDHFLKIVNLYTQHIEKENRNFFRPAFEYFSEEETKMIVDEFINVDRKMIHEKYFQIVEDLNVMIQGI